MEDQQQFKADCLAKHNSLRAEHGAPALEWSDACETDAQRQADLCHRQQTLQHGNNDGQGQNCAMAGPFLTGESAVQMWYHELVDPGFDFSNPEHPANPGTGHFTQVVWLGSTHVGAARSADGKYVVANYTPPGNMIGSFGANVLPPKSPQRPQPPPAAPSDANSDTVFEPGAFPWSPGSRTETSIAGDGSKVETKTTIGADGIETVVESGFDPCGTLISQTENGSNVLVKAPQERFLQVIEVEVPQVIEVEVEVNGKRATCLPQVIEVEVPQVIEIEVEVNGKRATCLPLAGNNGEVPEPPTRARSATSPAAAGFGAGISRFKRAATAVKMATKLEKKSAETRQIRERAFNDQLVDAHTVVRRGAALPSVAYSAECRARAQRWADKLAQELGTLQRGGCEGLQGPKAAHGQNLLVFDKQELGATRIDGSNATLKWLNGPECFKAQVMHPDVTCIGGGMADDNPGKPTGKIYVVCHYINGMPLREVEVLQGGASLDSLATEAANSRGVTLDQVKMHATKQDSENEERHQQDSENEERHQLEMDRMQAEMKALDEIKRVNEQKKQKMLEEQEVLAKESVNTEEAQKAAREAQRQRRKNDPALRRQCKLKAEELRKVFLDMQKLIMTEGKDIKQDSAWSKQWTGVIPKVVSPLQASAKSLIASRSPSPERAASRRTALGRSPTQGWSAELMDTELEEFAYVSERSPLPRDDHFRTIDI